VGTFVLLLFLGAELEAPVRLESQGKPIDVFGGHAAPSIADLDGDGVRDLLVGQFIGEGRNPFEAPVRLYKGPRLESFAYLPGVSVPSG
jgi:hypothetical protein